jgi:signal transduction histidine kinase
MPPKPLQYRRALERLGPIWRRSLGVIAASLCLVLAVGYLLYSLMLFWLKNEMILAAVEATREDTAAMARELAQWIDPSRLATTPSPLLHQLTDPAFTWLLDRHEEVLAVLMIDKHERVLEYKFGARVEQAAPNFLHRTSFPHPIEESDANTLVDIFRQQFPGLRSLSIEFRDRENGQVTGHLWVLVDESVPIEFLERVSARMPAPVTLALLAVGAALGLGGVLIVRQRHSAQDERRQRDEAEELAYVGTLAAGLAHEIGNPLNALTMQLEMLEEDAAQGSSDLITQRIQRIRGGLGGVDRTVREFLSYASPGQQSPRMVELSPFIESLCREFESGHAETPLQLERIVAPGLAAWCDPHALRQILGNLLSNGLRAQHQRQMTTNLRVEAARRAGAVEVLVDDGGPGVPEAIRDEIFHCFFTTRSDGTGLGLAIARRLAEMNGGALELDVPRAPLGGARFRLRMPDRPRER